jgi:hypothetical protein
MNWCPDKELMFSDPGMCTANCPSACVAATQSPGGNAGSCGASYKGFVYSANTDTTYALTAAGYGVDTLVNNTGYTTRGAVITGQADNDVAAMLTRYYNTRSWIAAEAITSYFCSNGTYYFDSATCSSNCAGGTCAQAVNLANYNTIDPARFFWVNGNPLSYTNFASGEPGNTVTLQDTQAGLSPLGEYWIEMGTDGLWYDAGKHATDPVHAEPIIVQFKGALDCVNGATLPPQGTNSLSGSICGKSANGQLTPSDFKQCIAAGGGYLCPIDLTSCQPVTTTYPATATLSGGVNYTVLVCKDIFGGNLSVSGGVCPGGTGTAGYLAATSFSGSVQACANALGGGFYGSAYCGGALGAGYLSSTSFTGGIQVCETIITGLLSISTGSCAGTGTDYGYIAPASGVYGGVTTYSCNSGDTLNGTTCTHLTGYACPYGSGYQCLLNGASWQCSDVSCANTVTTQPDTSSYQNDGQVDANTGQCLGQIYIFNGSAGTCKEPGVDTNFFQCCTTDTGSFLFVEAVCGTGDRTTSEALAAGRAHYVGNYCADSWPLIGCVQSARTYCIFQSKLGRIVQEQGRMQLKAFQDAYGNPYWGTPQAPNCRGFTPQEFQSLDFSKMDLSEYFADIKTKADSAIQQDMKNNVQNYYNNNVP